MGAEASQPDAMQNDTSAPAQRGAAIDRWTALLTAGDVRSFCAAWLEIVVTRLSGVQLAGVLHRAAAAEYRPVAQWPAEADPRQLAGVVQRALQRRELAESPDGLQLAFPVEAAAGIVAVVALQLAPQEAAARLANLRELYWACAWLRLLDSGALAPPSAGTASAAGPEPASRLVLLALEQVQAAPDVAEAGLALSNLLAAELAAQRVGLALATPRGARLTALSDTPWFDRRGEAAAQLEAAAQEALDGRRSRQWPGEDAATPALAALGRARQASVAVVPLAGRGAAAAAALVVERETTLPLAPQELLLLEQLGRWVGPALELLAQQDRWFTGRAALQWQRLRTRLADPRRPGLALLGSAAALLLLGIALVPVEHRVTATAVVEGAREIAIAAPFEGYVGRSLHRAGDSVRAGQPLALLDDRQLRLDWERWESTRVQHERRHVDALARRDRAAAGMAQAAMDEARAQVDLAAFRLQHAALRAEVDGFVVSGDLSQQIGAPVRRGQVLFRVAPLGEYRVVLRVDERDIRLVAPGQAGEMVLTGDTSGRRAFRLTAIGAPEAGDGFNGFRVEAALDAGAAPLRPGMEGVAKVVVGEAPLAVAWTRRARQWLQAAWFRHLP